MALSSLREGLSQGSPPEPSGTEVCPVYRRLSIWLPAGDRVALLRNPTQPRTARQARAHTPLTWTPSSSELQGDDLWRTHSGRLWSDDAA